MNEDWISRNGKLVCTSCGLSKELGMPNYHSTLKREGGRYVTNEFYEISQGLDKCICKSARNRVTREEIEAIIKQMDEKDPYSKGREQNEKIKTFLFRVLLILAVLYIFFFVDLA